MPPESESARSKTVSHLIAFSHNKFCAVKTDAISFDKIMTCHNLVKFTWVIPAGLEELWLGITFDPLEEALSWEPTCPVAAVVALCQKREDGICVDLPGSSQNVSREKVSAFDMLSSFRAKFLAAGFGHKSLKHEI